MKWIVRGASGSHEVEVVRRTAGGFRVTVNGREIPVELLRLNGGEASLRFVEDGRSFHVAARGDARRRWQVSVGERRFDWSVLTPVEAIESEAAADGHGPSRVEAPIPGKVVSVRVAVGDAVESGQSLVVLEAMKMENDLAADRSGTVTAVHVEAGATVEAGAPLVDLE